MTKIVNEMLHTHGPGKPGDLVLTDENCFMACRIRNRFLHYSKVNGSLKYQNDRKIQSFVTKTLKAATENLERSLFEVSGRNRTAIYAYIKGNYWPPMQLNWDTE